MRRVFMGGAAVVAMVFALSLTASANPTCQQADFNGDGKIDDIDISIFKNSIGKLFGQQGYLPAADLDGSGTITYIDFQLMLSCR